MITGHMLLYILGQGTHGFKKKMPSSQKKGKKTLEPVQCMYPAKRKRPGWGESCTLVWLPFPPAFESPLNRRAIVLLDAILSSGRTLSTMRKDPVPRRAQTNTNDQLVQHSLGHLRHENIRMIDDFFVPVRHG